MLGWRRAVGDHGESLAEAHLKRQGFRILHRNLRTPYGEIDLVCRDGGAIVLVEVKTRRSKAKGLAIESITAAKRRALTRSAQYLARRYRWGDVRVRFDVVAIQFSDDATAEPEVRHVRNAFEASE